MELWNGMMNPDAASVKGRGTCVSPYSRELPPRAAERLGAEAPPQLTVLGNPALLDLPKTALLCSVRCPGTAILPALDQAEHWRATGRCVIGGFQAPLDKECLRVLLRGRQPVIICPGRGLSTATRVPPEWKRPLAEGRLLLVSGFAAAERRVTTELAWRRNLLVAALADELYLAHVAPGGHLEELVHRVRRWSGLESVAPAWLAR